MSPSIRGIVFALLVLAPIAVFAAAYKVGDRVEAAPQADRSKWELCDVSAVLPDEQYELICGELNAHIRVGAHWIRPHPPKPAAAADSKAPPKK
jgi:hypothetical protein